MNKIGRYFLTSEDGEATEITRDTLIGREDYCDLVITDGHPSRRHAQITLEQGKVFVEDLGSANGTFLNRVKITEKMPLKQGDKLAFGLGLFHFSHEIDTAPGEPTTDPNRTQLVDDAELAAHMQCRWALRDENLQQTLDLEQLTRVGRESSAATPVDWIMDNPGVSKLHATLNPQDDGVMLEDLGSSNGTYLNNQRIAAPTLAHHGDRIRFHLVEFNLIDRSQAPEGEFTATPIPEDPDLAEADMGGTVVMPIKSNLPPVWDESLKQGTMVMSPAELKKQAAQQIDRQLQATVDAPTFLILSGRSAGRPYRLECTAPVNYWNIGRNPVDHELSIVLDDPSISDFHAKLIYREGRWKIIDQMSTNSIYVNGQRHASAHLSSSDHIRLGRIDTLLLLPSAKTGTTPHFASRIFHRLRELLGLSSSR